MRPNAFVVAQSRLSISIIRNHLVAAVARVPETLRTIVGLRRPSCESCQIVSSQDSFYAQEHSASDPNRFVTETVIYFLLREHRGSLEYIAIMTVIRNVTILMR